MNSSTQVAADSNLIVRSQYDAKPAPSAMSPRLSDNTGKPLVASIKVIHNRLLSEGYQISEYMLRQMVKQGIIPVVYSGCKALISYSAVVKVLTCATG